MYFLSHSQNQFYEKHIIFSCRNINYRMGTWIFCIQCYRSHPRFTGSCHHLYPGRCNSQGRRWRVKFFECCYYLSNKEFMLRLVPKPGYSFLKPASNKE